jgi:hypothetical protein
VSGCFLNEFGQRPFGVKFGHNPDPSYRPLLNLKDEAAKSSSTLIGVLEMGQLQSGFQRWKRFLLKNYAAQKVKITVFATCEIRKGKLTMTKGGTVIYRSSMHVHERRGSA